MSVYRLVQHYHFRWLAAVFPWTYLLSASPICSLSRAADLEEHRWASLDFRENNHTQSECDRKRFPDSAKAISIMLFPTFL